MNLRKIINEYTDLNEFEIKIKNKKVNIYYYKSVESISSNKIIINSNDNIVEILGNNLVIETMYNDFLIINGNIKKIILVN